MSLSDQQNVLAKLYTDTQFRRDFLSEPEKIGLANNLSKSEITQIAEVMPEELNFFAESLFWKRLREVEKFLPLTKEHLPEKFDSLFREFSENYHPQSVKKHLEDAFEFGKFLQCRKFGGFASEIIAFELAKMEFFGFEKKFVARLFRYNFRTGQKLRTIRICFWLRIGKKKYIY